MDNEGFELQDRTPNGVHAGASYHGNVNYKNEDATPGRDDKDKQTKSGSDYILHSINRTHQAGYGTEDLVGYLGDSRTELYDTWSMKSELPSKAEQWTKIICYIFWIALLVIGVILLIVYFAVWKVTTNSSPKVAPFWNSSVAVLCNENSTAFANISRDTHQYLFSCPDGACLIDGNIQRPLFGACCTHGHCHCFGEGYNPYTCLPEVGACKILINHNKTSAKPYPDSATYSCLVSPNNVSNEIHVIGVFKSKKVFVEEGRVPTMGVRINGETKKRLIIALSCIESVKWELNITEGLNISSVLLFSKSRLSSVKASDGRELNVELYYNSFPTGYGLDSERNGDTVHLIQSIEAEHGQITSFTGTPLAESWTLNV